MVSRKSQSAIELMSVYTWAFFAVILSIGALIYFGVLDSDRLSTAYCSTGSEVQCLEGSIDGNTGLLTMTLRNNLPADIVIKDIQYVIDGTTYNTVPSTIIEKGKKTMMAGPVLVQNTFRSSKKKVEVIITYSRSGGAAEYKVVGSAIVQVLPATANYTAPICNYDNICSGDETYENCPADCPVPVVCGDGICDYGEDMSCPGDCIGTGDLTPPVVNVYHTPTTIDTSTEVTVFADATDNSGNVSSIVISVDGLLSMCGGTHCYTTPRNYSVGVHNYSVFATDPSGNVGRDPVNGTKNFTVTTTPSGPVCGDFVCETGEDWLNCSSDCLPLALLSNMLDNGGFDYRGYTNWTQSTNVNCSMTCTTPGPGQNSSINYSSCQITSYLAGGYCRLRQMSTVNPRIVIGHDKTYHVYFRARGPSNGNDIQLRIRRNGGTYESFCEAHDYFNIPLTSSWEDYSFDCISNTTHDESNVMFEFLYEQGGIAVGDVYEIDSVYLTDVTPGIDLTPPTLIVSHNPTYPVLLQMVEVRATISDASDITNASVYIDGVRHSCIGNVGVCSYIINYSLGMHTYYATAYDNSSNHNFVRVPAARVYNFTVTSSGEVCGNAVCGSNETELTCPQDCPLVLDSILSNPSFESGTSSWGYYSDGNASFTSSNASNDTFHLLRGSRFAVITPGSNVQFWQLGISMVSNSQYFLSFYAKSNTGHDLKISFQNGSSPWNSFGLMNSPFDLNNIWHEYNITFTTPYLGGLPSNDGMIKFWFADDATAGDVYNIDRVVLRKIGAVNGTNDTIAPIVFVNTTKTSPSVNENFAFTAYASDNVDVTSMSIVIDEGTANEIVHTCSSVSFCQYSHTYSTSATHYFYATARDAAGNTVRNPTSGLKAVYIVPGFVCTIDGYCNPAAGENSGNCDDCIVSSSCNHNGVCELGEYTNVCVDDCVATPDAGLPKPSVNVVGNKLYRAGYLDATLYGADPTGVQDSTNAIQNALNDGIEKVMSVYLPSGTYLVSGTIHSEVPITNSWTSQGYFGPILNGAYIGPSIVGEKGSTRPTIKLKANSPGFDNPNVPKAVLHFRCINEGTGETGWVGDQDSCYNFVVHGINIEIGTGNPGAVGLAIPSAQRSTVEDVTINAGSGYAGIHGIPTTNIMENIEVIGGRYGVINLGASDMTIAGLTLRDQTEAGVLSKNSIMVTISGFDIEQPSDGYAVSVDNGNEQDATLSLVDGIIRVQNPSKPVIYNPGQNNIYMSNTYMNGAGLVSENGGAAPRSISSGWQRIQEYAYTDPSSVLPWNPPLVYIESWKLIDGSLSKTDRWSVASGSPPNDLVSRHIWSNMPWFTDLDAKWVDDTDIGAKGDRVTDDTNALQFAIDHYEKVFVPWGDYKITRPLIMHANTKLFGTSDQRAQIFPDFDPNPAGQNTYAIITDSDANGHAYLGDFFVRLPSGYARSIMGVFDWRVGRNSIVRQIASDFAWEEVSASLARYKYMVEGNGGGRIYGIVGGNYNVRNVNPGRRWVLVSGTIEPLTFYGPNMEGGGGDANYEIRNAQNVRILGTKSEPGTTVLFISNSNNVFVTGMTNNIGTQYPDMVRITNSNNVLASNMFILRGAHAGELGNMLTETYGGNTYTIPGKDNVNVFRRGDYDYAAFNP